VPDTARLHSVTSIDTFCFKIILFIRVKDNRHIKKINIAVTDLNNTGMFLEYDWLVKYNSEVNWNKGIIYFTRSLRGCRI